MTTGRINQVTILDRPRADRPWDGRVSSPGANARVGPDGSKEPPGTPDLTGLESPRTTRTEEGRPRPAPSGLPRGELPTDTDRGPRPSTDSRRLRQIPGQRPSTHQPPTVRGVSRRPSQPKVRRARAEGKSRPFHAGADGGTVSPRRTDRPAGTPVRWTCLVVRGRGRRDAASIRALPHVYVRPHRPSVFHSLRFAVQTPERRTNVDTHTGDKGRTRRARRRGTPPNPSAFARSTPDGQSRRRTRRGPAGGARDRTAVSFLDPRFPMLMSGHLGRQKSGPVASPSKLPSGGRTSTHTRGDTRVGHGEPGDGALPQTLRPSLDPRPTDKVDVKRGETTPEELGTIPPPPSSIHASPCACPVTSAVRNRALPPRRRNSRPAERTPMGPRSGRDPLGRGFPKCPRPLFALRPSGGRLGKGRTDDASRLHAESKQAPHRFRPQSTPPTYISTPTRPYIHASGSSTEATDKPSGRPPRAGRGRKRSRTHTAP
jgi:hypothetical protein